MEPFILISQFRTMTLDCSARPVPSLYVRLDRVFPRCQTGFDSQKDGVVLTIILLFGLIGVVPAFTLTVQQLAIPLPLPTLICTAIVLTGYVAAIVALRRVLIGSAVALVVLSTFAADVPLVSGGNYPGSLGPRLWLFQVPLVALIAYHVLAGNYSRDSFSLVEIAPVPS